MSNTHITNNPPPKAPGCVLKIKIFIHPDHYLEMGLIAFDIMPEACTPPNGATGGRLPEGPGEVHRVWCPDPPRNAADRRARHWCAPPKTIHPIIAFRDHGA